MPISFLLHAIWKQRLIVIVSTVSVAIAAGIAAFRMERTYSASVTALTVDADSSQGMVSRLVNQFGGLAAIAGVGMSNRRAEAVAILRSQAVIEAFITENDLLPVLFEDLWDSENSRWRVPPDEAPTVQQGYGVFNADIRRVREDPTAGTVTLEILWKDRTVAAEWANGIVQMVNNTMRARTIEEATKMVNYLNAELEKTSIIELRQVLYNVIQEQVNTIALANSREQFGLRIVDPAVPSPEGSYVRPRRTLMILGGVIAGWLLGVLAGLLRERLL